jgi:hypothetical protein
VGGVLAKNGKKRHFTPYIWGQVLDSYFCVQRLFERSNGLFYGFLPTSQGIFLQVKIYADKIDNIVIGICSIPAKSGQ